MVIIFVTMGTLSCLPHFVKFASKFSITTFCLSEISFKLNMTMLTYIVCQCFAGLRSQIYKFDLKNDHVIIVCVLQVQVN
jgi:hypothetical protein